MRYSRIETDLKYVLLLKLPLMVNDVWCTLHDVDEDGLTIETADGYRRSIRYDEVEHMMCSDLKTFLKKPLARLARYD